MICYFTFLKLNVLAFTRVARAKNSAIFAPSLWFLRAIKTGRRERKGRKAAHIAIHY
jgi:hypothetical protein